MPNIIDITHYNPKFGDSFFFDNNIWVTLFYPKGDVDSKKQTIYSNLLDLIKQRNCAIYINSLILSEFCNYWLRTDFKLFSKGNNSLQYKRDFIGTDSFYRSVSYLKETLTRILKTTEKANDDFNAISFENIMTEFGTCDFNDSYYLELARQNKWKIVTEDTDFFKDNKLNIDIITTKS